MGNENNNPALLVVYDCFYLSVSKNKHQTC